MAKLDKSKLGELFGKGDVGRAVLHPKHAVLTEKLRESLISALPIVIIVLLVCLTISPVPTGLMLSFLLGALLVVVGMGLFSLGADTAMTPIGNRIGTTLTKSQKLPLILFVSFVVGVAVTVAEPDLQVLADSISHVNKTVLIATVGVGVGLFLAVCMLRIIFGIKLKWFLLAAYVAVFVLAAFSDKGFLSIAFDSGGVTTGPMTVPFILALGVGVANIRSDKTAEADSFGLVALCSIGPILAVLILGFFYSGDGSTSVSQPLIPATTTEMGFEYLKAFPQYMKEMAIALAPIIALFLLFQFVSFKLNRSNFLRILMGILYTYVGLVLFLTGVNVGFSPLGAYLGQQLFDGWTQYLLIPLAMLLGWFIISAEPAVAVLEKQIEDVTSGAIPGKVIKISLSIAIAIAMGLSMVRVLTGISILWFIVPGYAISLILMFFVPDIFTAIAFDSGGVASGPMTATFMLQFFIGVCSARGGNIMTDAFGVVAMVAMMPLLSIQITGLVYKKKQKRAEITQEYGDTEIIELWG